MIYIISHYDKSLIYYKSLWEVWSHSETLGPKTEYLSGPPCKYIFPCVLKPSHSWIHPKEPQHGKIHFWQEGTSFRIQCALAAPLAAVFYIHLNRKKNTVRIRMYTSQAYYWCPLILQIHPNTSPPQGGRMCFRGMYIPLMPAVGLDFCLVTKAYCMLARAQYPSSPASCSDGLTCCCKMHMCFIYLVTFVRVMWCCWICHCQSPQHYPMQRNRQHYTLSTPAWCSTCWPLS